jgi:hypothetical protein
MTDKRLDRMIVISSASLLLCVGVAALASMYASGQGSRFFEELASGASGQKSLPSSWSTLRTGAILGSLESSKGNHLYIMVLRRPGGEYRALADVRKDGTILSVTPLGASNGFVFSTRIEALLGRIIGHRKDGDASPLDGTIKPLVLDVVETIANLEMARMEGRNGK